MKNLRWLIGISLIMALTIPFMLLPRRLADTLGCRLGALLYLLLGKWRRLAINSIKSALPFLRSHADPGQRFDTPEQLARQVFINIGQLLSELSRMYHNRDQELLANVQFVGLENYFAAKERGKGLMFITAHSGNWELLALSFGARYDPVAVVGRQMDKLYVNRILEKMRCRFGNSVIYRDRASRELLEAFKKNRNVGLLVDQATDAANGLKCDFLGRPAWTTKLPVKLAMKTGAALVPIFIRREGDRHIVTIHPELPLSTEGSAEERLYRDTCRLNSYIDDYIIHYPDQWNWLYNRWKRT